MRLQYFTIVLLYGLTLAAPRPVPSTTSAVVSSVDNDADLADLYNDLEKLNDTLSLQKRYGGSIGHKIACWLKCHMPDAGCPKECKN